MEDILVSICCLTYNHEKYIRKALDGFIMQKTNFKFEVLIHDDASTDGTADIVREYESKYPDIIKPIYQTENQHSKGVRISRTYQYPRAKGKYIALCEGDDYWTSENKLQEQVDYMETHPGCSICCHAANLVSAENELKDILKPYNNNRKFDVETFFNRKVNIPTASLLFTNAVKEEYPDFLQNSPVGDIPIVLYYLTKGYGYYMDEVRSAYRTGVRGSWTSTNRTKEKKIYHYKRMQQMYDEFQKYTDYKYSYTIRTRINVLNMNILIESGKSKEAKEKYPDLYKKSRVCTMERVKRFLTFKTRKYIKWIKLK